MSEPKLIYVIIYTILMIALSIRAFKKKKHIIYCMLWIANTVSAVFCILCKVFHNTLVGNGIMQAKWYDLSDTTLFGYLLIVLCCYIAFRPFEVFDKKEALMEFDHHKGKKSFFRIFTYTYIILALVFLLLSLKTVFSLLNLSDYGAIRLALYNNVDNESTFIMTDNFMANICYKLCLQFKYMNVFVSLMMLKERESTRLAVFSLILNFLIY